MTAVLWRGLVPSSPITTSWTVVPLLLHFMTNVMMRLGAVYEALGLRVLVVTGMTGRVTSWRCAIRVRGVMRITVTALLDGRGETTMMMRVVRRMRVGMRMRLPGMLRGIMLL